MMTEKALADSRLRWSMVTSSRGLAEHGSFLQLSVTHMRCKKWVIQTDFVEYTENLFIAQVAPSITDNPVRWGYEWNSSIPISQSQKKSNARC
jgi:hypothetical protein